VHSGASATVFCCFYEDKKMLEQISEQLSEVIEQKRRKKKLEQDLKSVENELQDQSARLDSLRTQLEKEKVDVERLEGTSLTGLFYAVLGSREEQLEKERQELLSAELKYQQARHQAAFLENEKAYLSGQLGKLTGVEARYQSLLAEKEDFLHQSNQAVAAELIAYSEKIAEHGSEIKEIREAIAAGHEVILGLDQVIGSLDSAKGWGTWDMLGGGLISTAVKHSRIDDARSAVSAVQAQMSRFSRELADVREHVDIQIDISQIESFADFFFDNLIFDWIVQSKITDSLGQSRQAKSRITQTVKDLEDVKKAAEQEQADLRHKRARLIEKT
jgi:hypothetical protein